MRVGTYVEKLSCVDLYARPKFKKKELPL